MKPVEAGKKLFATGMEGTEDLGMNMTVGGTPVHIH